VAVDNIQRMCEEHLKGRYDLEVIDIHDHAQLARDEQIVAVPTLIKRLPAPLQRLVGDMSDLNKVLFGLDLKVRPA
jgi:circadian clock protein KaiB